MGSRVSNQEDGDGGQPYVSHQVLIVARLSPNLGQKWKENFLNVVIVQSVLT